MAGAYLVFLTLILVYVAIMARQDRPHRPRADRADEPRRTVNGELLALGASHKTAPLPLRERLALPAGPGGARAGAS